MPALEAGVKAPAVKLPLVAGGTFDLAEALKRGPVVVAFFKISCPVCQFTFPYLERIYRSYPQGQYTLLGVSQDEENYTEEFAREYGISFPLALEDVDEYAVSNAYGLTNVPTIFMISPGGGVQLTIIGWDRREMEKLNREVARVSGAAVNILFQPGEDIPESQPG